MLDSLAIVSASYPGADHETLVKKQVYMVYMYIVATRRMGLCGDGGSGEGENGNEGDQGGRGGGGGQR